MTADKQSKKRIPCYCALCISRCGSIAVVENGRFVALEPDPSHPTGRALCAKGRAAPELVYHQDRLLYPMKRTRPKGDPDPGWQRISWDEALDIVASEIQRVRKEHGKGAILSGTGSHHLWGWIGYWLSTHRRFMNTIGYSIIDHNPAGPDRAA